MAQEIRNHLQLRETTLNLLPTIRIQHARAVAEPTSSAVVPFAFKTVNNNDLFDLETINAIIRTTFNTLMTPAATGRAQSANSQVTSGTKEYVPSAMLIESIFPPASASKETSSSVPGTTTMNSAWPAPSSSTRKPTATGYTDLSQENGTNRILDAHKTWTVVGMIGAVAVLITVVAVICRFTSDKRWRRKVNKQPVERMNMVLPGYIHPRGGASIGLDGVVGLSDNFSASTWAGGSSRGHSGRHFGSHGSLPAYPGRTYAYGQMNDRLHGERKYFGGV